MTHEACESKLRSVVRSSVHPYPGNWVAIGRAVVYYAWAARTFSAEIKCRHCSGSLPKWSCPRTNNTPMCYTSSTWFFL